MSRNQRPAVVVVGSLHFDIMVDAPRRPRKGETVTGHAWRPKFGGKGGNQAVAAAKAGADARMAGAVGDDDFGKFLLKALGELGVDASHVSVLPGTGSGMSVAISDASGDYGAVIVSGANLKVDAALITSKQLWEGAQVVVLQNEMPETSNIEAARAARTAGASVCVNAAPYRPLSEEFASLIDVLVVNAIEAEELSGVPVSDLKSAARAAAGLIDRFQTVVVTAGGDGVVGLKRGEPPVSLPALPVKLVSTHGAGDAFVGALAHAMALKQSLRECLETANAAAANHVSAPAG